MSHSWQEHERVVDWLAKYVGETADSCMEANLLDLLAEVRRETIEACANRCTITGDITRTQMMQLAADDIEKRIRALGEKR